MRLRLVHRPLAILGLLAIPIASALAAPPGAVQPVRAAPDIALATVDGAEFRLRDHRGAVVVIVFGYTLCPDMCPMTLAKLAHVRTQLPVSGEAVRVVFVTLDPQRDTTARVRTYTRAFDRSVVGLTGTARALAEVRDAYGVVAGRRDGPGATGYLVDHSTFVFVVDRAGQLRFMFPAEASVDDMVQGLASILD